MEWVLFTELNDLAIGAYETVSLPEGLSEGETLRFDAEGNDSNGSGIVFEQYNDLEEGQQISLALCPVLL